MGLWLWSRNQAPIVPVEASRFSETKNCDLLKPTWKWCWLFFFDKLGVVHHENAPKGQTIKQTYYLEVLKRLRDALRRKRPERWIEDDWFLHHGNAPAHRALSIQQFLAKHRIPLVPHPPYSPDLAPADFFLFPQLKSALKSHRFDTIDGIKENATDVLRNISENDYENCFSGWTDRWLCFVNAEGKYFEGN